MSQESKLRLFDCDVFILGLSLYFETIKKTITDGRLSGTQKTREGYVSYPYLLFPEFC